MYNPWGMPFDAYMDFARSLRIFKPAVAHHRFTARGVKISIHAIRAKPGAGYSHVFKSIMTFTQAGSGDDAPFSSDELMANLSQHNIDPRELFSEQPGTFRY